MTRALVLAALTATLATLAGCAGEGDAPLGADAPLTEAAATSPLPELSPFAGRWRVESSSDESVRGTVLVQASRFDGGGLGPDWAGPMVRLTRGDASSSIFDRQPFVRVGLPKKCASDELGDGSLLEVCHETTLVGAVLTHTMVATQKYDTPPPASTGVRGTESQASIQTLTLEGSSLVYHYEIDGEVYSHVRLAR